MQNTDHNKSVYTDYNSDTDNNTSIYTDHNSDKDHNTSIPFVNIILYVYLKIIIINFCQYK